MRNIVIRGGLISGLAATSFLFAGCASTPPPTDKVALASSAVDTASSAGAGEYASVELSRARTKLEGAKAALAQRDYGKAHVLAEQAEADAQVARAKANAERARKAADEVDNGLKTLREELNRRTTAPAPIPPATR